VRSERAYRWYAGPLRARLGRPFVHLLFGARQTGTSTLIRALLPEGAAVIDLADPGSPICRCARPMRLHEKVMALPWHCL